MNKIKFFIEPKRNEWNFLIQRPQIGAQSLQSLVQEVFLSVQNEGDVAIERYTHQFDGASLSNFQVSEEEIKSAFEQIPTTLKKAIEQAYENIYTFHFSQKERKKVIETVKGVECWRESRPIQKVGIYIPGGSAPLFSTVLMLGIPAQIAGCQEIILCSPPNKSGKIDSAILYSAARTGITRIYKIGGIQAIAAMSVGTETVPKVYKIFGPGNQYVTAAKKYAQEQGTAIDMPAGPSEVLIIADKYAQAEFVAADLLSQAEHGTDSQVVLLTNHLPLLDKVQQHIQKQLQYLPRYAITEQALNNSFFIYFNTLETCFEFANEYAPEHLILNLKNYKKWIAHVHNAGSVFLGQYSCETAGDYASGTNHTLPTAGFAKAYSGVSLDSFVKKITFQRISKKGLLKLGTTLEVMAEHESLLAHKNAVTLRLNHTPKKS
ncbi:MAG: histidinol dehydrogenase [Bacteroidia bacterium]|nr:histidinol dehydrogenase [Bacteroidia bacterium]MDW8346948.1 histidinol dehydrogenase [Bacteroidia bacterium]